MKKYFILLLFFLSAVSCKNESLSIGSSNYMERHNLPTSRNIDYEWYLEFYEQIYSIIENISQDTILNNLISEENLYLEFDSEALIENGLTTLLLETFTSQQINILSYDFFGGTLADFENDEGISDDLRALLSDLLVMDYIEPEYLFELLHESNFTIGETIILYGISSLYNISKTATLKIARSVLLILSIVQSFKYFFIVSSKVSFFSITPFTILFMYSLSSKLISLVSFSTILIYITK